MSNLIASDDLGISLQKLREMVASSETFQSGIQGGYGDALDRIYIGRQLGSPTRPFASIESNNLTAALIAGGEMNFLRLNGDVKLHIEIDADTTLDEPDQVITASAFCYGVIADVNNLSAVDNTAGEFGESHLPTVNIQVPTIAKNERKYWNSMGQFFNCIASIQWGDG